MKLAESGCSSSSQLIECAYSLVSTTECSHDQDAGVRCFGMLYIQMVFITVAILSFLGIRSYRWSQLQTVSLALLSLTAPTAETSCLTRNLRLVGGASDSEGRVEYCLDRVWRAVTDYHWDTVDAMVACRDLGLPFECE